MNNMPSIISNLYLPKDIVFWTGAGISADAPSFLPLGNELTKVFIDSFNFADTWQKTLEYFRKAKMLDEYGQSKTAPRLEAVLENLIKIHGFEILRGLDPIHRIPPNPNHFFFAQHLISHGVHFTVNLDNGIENAIKILEQKQTSPKALRKSKHQANITHNLIYVHGKHEPTTRSLEKLGIRISKVANGVLHPIDGQIQKHLSSCRTLIFLGYSGSDYFDINPFFYYLNQTGLKLNQLEAIWIKHTRQSSVKTINDWDIKNANGSVILRGIQKAGGRVQYLETNTSTFLKSLATSWNIPWIVSTSAKTGKVQHTSKTLQQSIIHTANQFNPDYKTISSAKHYSFMGIGKETVGLSNQLELLAKKHNGKDIYREIIFLICNGLRDTGKYLDAQKQSRKLPSITISDKIFRYNRIAGDHWLRGSFLISGIYFLLAYIQMLSARDRNKLSQIALGIYEEYLLTFLHWFRDFRKISVIGRLLPLSLAVSAFDYFQNNNAYTFLDPHAIGKLKNLHSDIPGLQKLVSLPRFNPTFTNNVVSIFYETDSILGVINFSRRNILYEYRTNNAVPSKRVLIDLLNKSNLINDRAGILKFSLLLKKFHRFTAPEASTAYREIQWNFWRKFSWKLGWFGIINSF